MGRFDRHLGKPVEVPLEYEENGETKTDIIKIKPLPIDNLVEWLDIAKEFKRIQTQNKDMDTSEAMLHLSKDGLNSLIKIIVDSIQHSYPDESQEDIRQFAFSNMAQIFPAIIKANASSSQAKEALSRMEAFKNARQQATSEPSDGSA